ncbi:hypothetical protein [Streptomonospora litoralis]|uniref:hypothetical protein n=1 Tax=Streptomonospora litoralis TaxID=2498135 RepID=UPI001036AFE2|nr:hypothetical protein [Streptomonospora litoralis]
MASATETAKTYVAALEDGNGEAGCSVASTAMRAQLTELAADEGGEGGCAAGFALFAAEQPGVGGMAVGEVEIGPWQEADSGAEPVAHAEIGYPDGADTADGMTVDGLQLPYQDGAWVVDADVH